MQWNQPFGSYGFQSYPKTGTRMECSDYNKQDCLVEITLFLVPQIVGEGDVTAITFPDGCVQFYFVPIIKHNQLPSPCSVRSPYSSLFSAPTNAEVWFVRSITNPQANLNFSVPPGYLNSQLPNTIGECPPYTPPNYCMNTYPPLYHEYTQKFHNDKWTSTTDIHYFYPSLRQAKCLQYCTETQTEILYPSNNLAPNGGCNRPCYCQSNSVQKHVNIELNNCNPKVQTKSSDSCMSVDSGSEAGQRKLKKYKKKTVKNKKTPKRDHVCECKLETRDTADKSMTTCADQATGEIAKGGRETQTKISKKSKKRKSKEPILKIKDSSSERCYCFSGSCYCSTSETDRR